MLHDNYFTEYNEDFTTYEFESMGNKGVIRKRVEYQLLDAKIFYNLGFGDINSITNEIDDKVVTNNGDGQKVVITVAQTLITFFRHYPDATVFATGSTTARTRLYQIGINNNLSEIKSLFDIYGLKRENWYPFEQRVNYEAFLVRKKNK